MKRLIVALGIAVALLAVGLAADALLNRGALAIEVANAGLRPSVPDHEWRSGTFAGWRGPQDAPTSIVIDDVALTMAPDFEIYRTWVWWSPSYWGGPRLLGGIDWGYWYSHEGDTVWYQVESATGNVTRAIIVQRER